MLIEPASKVSALPTVVIRIAVNVPLNAIDPAEKYPAELSLRPSEPTSDHEFVLWFIKVKTILP